MFLQPLIQPIFPDFARLMLRIVYHILPHLKRIFSKNRRRGGDLAGQLADLPLKKKFLPLDGCKVDGVGESGRIGQHGRPALRKALGHKFRTEIVVGPLQGLACIGGKGPQQIIAVMPVLGIHGVDFPADILPVLLRDLQLIEPAGHRGMDGIKATRYPFLNQPRRQHQPGVAAGKAVKGPSRSLQPNGGVGKLIMSHLVDQLGKGGVGAGEQYVDLPCFFFHGWRSFLCPAAGFVALRAAKKHMLFCGAESFSFRIIASAAADSKVIPGKAPPSIPGNCVTFLIKRHSAPLFFIRAKNSQSPFPPCNSLPFPL